MDDDSNEWTVMSDMTHSHKTRSGREFIIYLYKHFESPYWICRVPYRNKRDNLKMLETEPILLPEDAIYDATMLIRNKFPETDVLQNQSEILKTEDHIPDIQC